VLSYIKKDLLLVWRDRKEIIIVLLLPILLVLVLNFVFAGLLGNNNELPTDLQIAVVNNDDDEKEAIVQLKEKLIQEASFNETEVAALLEQTSSVLPGQMLVDYLRSEEVKEWITVHELNENDAVKKVKEGELDGTLIIPKGFTANSLYAAYVKESPTIKLQFKIEKETNSNQIAQNIIQGFLDHLNFQFALHAFDGVAEADVPLPEGGFEELGAAAPFTLSQYFTIAMGALFSLFLAVTVATKTGVEIRQQVFNRILLTNSNPLHFLIGKMVSTFILVWLQIMFVFIVSHAIFDVFPERSIGFWAGTVGVVSLLSLSIAGLAAVFTVISLKMTNIDAANGVFMAVILLFGVMGGNFVPIYVLPDWLKQIGEWTPNGLSLVMLTEWIQFEEVSSLVMPGLLLIVFMLFCTVISVVLYPKRGVA
jgi:ABC-2 type transport system permease protein